MRVFALIALIAAASAARAGDNDIQLFRLGNPDDIVVCRTVCDGSDREIRNGAPEAQTRFARFTAALGLAFVPALFEPAGTTGQSGIEIGFSGSVPFLRIGDAEWATAGTQAAARAPRALFLPTVSIRKGLGGSVELGVHASYLAGSQMVATGGELRWAFVEGLEMAPDLAVRAYVTRVLGTQELDLLVGGFDVGISKGFGVGGMMQLQPYFQYGLAFVNATTGVIDFEPAREDAKDPTADDGVFRSLSFFKNRYHRFVLGLRLVAGVAVVGLEGSHAFGSNAVQSDPLTSGAAPPSQTTKMWSAAGRLGFSF